MANGDLPLCDFLYLPRPTLCSFCCSLFLSITAHWQLAIHLGWPRNAHLSDSSPRATHTHNPSPKLWRPIQPKRGGWDQGERRGVWDGKLANKVAIGYYNFPVSAFLQSSHKTTATTAASAVSSPPCSASLALRPCNFCSHKHNNFQCALNCSGKRVAAGYQMEGGVDGGGAVLLAGVESRVLEPNRKCLTHTHTHSRAQKC